MTISRLACAGALIFAACGGGEDGAPYGGDDDSAGDSDAGAGSVPECFSSSECPVGWTCSELGFCIPPPTTGPDGGTPPPEVEYEFSAPVSSRRYVWVAMTDQDR